MVQTSYKNDVTESTFFVVCLQGPYVASGRTPQEAIGRIVRRMPMKASVKSFMMWYVKPGGRVVIDDDRIYGDAFCTYLSGYPFQYTI